ncbi:MAG: XkdW family protein, partial [Anaerolineales bacterium]|nr:XkdW family protein [Anaerolineales bacterium]
MISAIGLIKLGFKSGTDFLVHDDGAGAYIAEWKSGSPQPTDADIETAHNQVIAEEASQEYARNRADAYPSVDDFMEAYTEKEIGSDSTKWDAYVIAY